MIGKGKYAIATPYWMTGIICFSFCIMAFVLDTPEQIFVGYYKIQMSRSVLVTDYIGLGGIGAALVNSAASGLLFLILLIAHRQAPSGKIIAALWTTIGFSLFGKNIANMLPILAGVLLYAIVNRIRFKDLFVQAMLSATIAPIVSEIAFLNQGFSLLRMVAAAAVGMLVGFIFPVVTEAAKRMHRGYCLYNCGTAGGLIATFCVGLLRSVGIEILPENIWDTSHTQLLAGYAYLLALGLISFGVIKEGPRRALSRFKLLIAERDREDDDYLLKYDNVCYINIGCMLIIATSAMLFLQIPINGPVLGGLFTVAGFGAAGKHPKNTLPILLGSAIATDLNYLEQTMPANSLAVLFSTGLAPIAGKHGLVWGVVIGFVHVSIAIFIGQLNGGLNLYNNGFAGAFVAITIVPVIVFLKETFNRYKIRQKAADK